MPLPEGSPNGQDSPTASNSTSMSVGSPCDSINNAERNIEEQCAKDEMYLERMRRHQSYAAQYRQEIDRGNFNSELGYLPADPEQTNQLPQKKEVPIREQSAKPSTNPSELGLGQPYLGSSPETQNRNTSQRQMLSKPNDQAPLSNGQTHQSVREQLNLSSTWSLVLPGVAAPSGTSVKTLASFDKGKGYLGLDMATANVHSNCSSNASTSPDQHSVELGISQAIGFSNQNSLGFSLPGYNGLPTPSTTTRTTPSQNYCNDAPTAISTQFGQYNSITKPYQAPIARPERASSGMNAGDKSTAGDTGVRGDNQSAGRTVSRMSSLYEMQSQPSIKSLTPATDLTRMTDLAGDYNAEHSFMFSNNQTPIPDYANLNRHSVTSNAPSVISNPFSHTPEPDTRFSVNGYFMPQLNVHQNGPFSTTELVRGDPHKSAQSISDYAAAGKQAFREHDRTQRWANELEAPMNNLYLTGSPPPVLASAGIDHYHGSPHQHSQYAPAISQAMKAASIATSISGSGNYTNYERSRHGSMAQRCGQNCQLNKTSLDEANKRITRLLREVDRLKNQVLELNYQLQISEGHRKALHAEMHQLQMAMTQSATARQDVTNRLDEYYRSFMAQFQSMPDSISNNHRIPSAEELKWLSDDNYVQQEFVMFFHDVKCWTERFLKFPTGVPISAELDALLHKMCDNKSELDFLLGNENTKAFVIMGLTVRWLKENVIFDAFSRQRNGFIQSEKQAEQRCENMTDYFHAMIIPWISRCHDQSVIRQCRESLQTCVRHATRLADLMVKAGGPTAWHIDFPAYGEPFRSDWMENVEDVRHRRGAQQRVDLEQYRVKLSGTPLIVRCKLESGQPDFSKIVQAQVLLWG